MAKNIYLTPHFTLEEMTRTNVQLGHLDRQRQTQPEEQVTENLTRVCQWLEMLRQRWNERYGEGDEPVVINSGYRCKELNRLVGGCPSSNHLTGCAADLRVDSCCATSRCCSTSATSGIRTSTSCCWNVTAAATGCTSPCGPGTIAGRYCSLTSFKN